LQYINPIRRDWDEIKAQGIKNITTTSVLNPRSRALEHLARVPVIVKSTLEFTIDTMKTSSENIPVLLVGGGAFVVSDTLTGASRVVKATWSGVANAVGAAAARVSGIVDSIEDTETRLKGEIVQEQS
jgi:hypothetical protein